MATLWGVMVLAKLRMKPSPYNKFAIFSMYVIGAVVGCAMSADFYTTWTTISADGFQVRTGLFHGLKEYDVKFADLSAMGLESVVVEGPKGPSHCVYMVCRYKDGSKRVEFDVSGNDVGFATRNPLRKAAAACGVPVLGYDGRPDPDFPLPLPLPQAPKADSAGPLPPAPKAAAATSEPSPTKP